MNAKTLVFVSLQYTRCQKPCVLLGFQQKTAAGGSVQGWVRKKRENSMFFTCILRATPSAAGRFWLPGSVAGYLFFKLGRINARFGARKQITADSQITSFFLERCLQMSFPDRLID